MKVCLREFMRGKVVPTSAAENARLALDFKTGSILMVTREKRLADFSSAPPTESKSLKLLCEDHCGTYVLPYPCSWTGDAWINAKSNHQIVAKVLGWRFW